MSLIWRQFDYRQRVAALCHACHGAGKMHGRGACGERGRRTPPHCLLPARRNSPSSRWPHDPRPPDDPRYVVALRFHVAEKE